MSPSPERSDKSAGPIPAAPLALLLSHHRRFRAFLERRLADAATAEDVLQDAYAKSLEKGAALRDGESVVAWFYRLLRNATADVARRRKSEAKALSARGRDQAFAIDPVELKKQVCRCVDGLLATLKPEDAEVLRRVDRGDESPTDVASALGVAAGTVRVRLHRARKSLKGLLERTCGACTRHGCLDCTCGGTKPRRAADEKSR